MLNKKGCLIMKYELDFIGVNEETKDADAIGIHWKKNDEHIIGVYDGGFSIHGENLSNIINNYYMTDEKKEIDFVICSHSDQDHVNGIKYILENNNVKKLYVNLPWNYIDDLYNKVNDGRITKKTLEERLKLNYRVISEIEEIANKKGVEICSAFEGDIICDRLTVLHPSKDTYVSLIADSTKNEFLENATNKGISIVVNSVVKHFKKVYNWIKETWSSESLREDVSTSSENETSIIILGDMESQKFLLVGDAGLIGLKAANTYYETLQGSLIDEVEVYQFPHHGGRHNVSSSILNAIIGKQVDEGVTLNKKAFVCVGKDSDHPLNMVKNAYIRRGVKVYVASGHTINHHKGFGTRSGWTSSKNEEFSSNVEDWDD